jgi:hypothetical protein
VPGSWKPQYERHFSQESVSGKGVVAGRRLSERSTIV